MPNKPAAKKYLRKSKKRYRRNRAARDNLKKIIKKTRKSIDDNEKKKAQNNLQTAIKALDKAAKSGVIKKNTAARKKSRLTIAYNKMK